MLKTPEDKSADLSYCMCEWGIWSRANILAKENTAEEILLI